MAVQKAEEKDERPPVQVIATARGHCGAALREPGDVFTVPASMFDKRPRLNKGQDGVTRQDGFYDPPSWFEEAVEAPVESARVVAKSKVKGGEDLT